MEKLVDLGLAKTIGVSNFQGALLIDLLRYARIRPALLQVEIHPYLTQNALVEFAKAEGIAVVAYSSFGPQSFIELKWDNAINCPPLFEHPVITALAKKHSKTPAQVLLRWATQRGCAIIPKSTTVDRMIQNLESVTFDLAKEEIASITALNQNIRFNNPPDVSTSPLSSFLFIADRCLLSVPWHSLHLRVDIGTLSYPLYEIQCCIIPSIAIALRWPYYRDEMRACRIK